MSNIMCARKHQESSIFLDVAIVVFVSPVIAAPVVVAIVDVTIN
jgi:hypothetical protein